jgi:hypothetical protein
MITVIPIVEKDERTVLMIFKSPFKMVYRKLAPAIGRIKNHVVALINPVTNCPKVAPCTSTGSKLMNTIIPK